MQLAQQFGNGCDGPAQLAHLPARVRTSFDIEQAIIDAQVYPQPGVIFDNKKNIYLVAPDYWVWWNRPSVRKGHLTRVGNTTPPAVWWFNREEWLEKWNQLDSGQLPFPWDHWRAPPMPMPPPDQKSVGDKLASMMGMAVKWWGWLKGHKDSETGAAFKKMAKAGKAPPDLGAKCNPLQFNKGSLPPAFQKYLDMEEKGVEAPTVPYMGFFGGTNWETQSWSAENLMRRQTLPGVADSKNECNAMSLRNATVRLDRFQNGYDEIATTDPRPIELAKNTPYPDSSGKPPSIKPYNGPMGALGAAMGDAVAEMLTGGAKIELAAYMRMTKADPEWMQKYMNYKEKQRALMEGLNNPPKAEAPLVTARRKKNLKPKMTMEFEAAPTWKPPPRPTAAQEIQAKWHEFWPAMERLARRQGKEAAATATELGKRLRSIQDTQAPHEFEEDGVLRKLRGATQRGLDMHPRDPQAIPLETPVRNLRQGADASALREGSLLPSSSSAATFL